MKTITLPDELQLQQQSVQIFDYHSSQEVAKQQIILNQNTFSFLMEGTKEVIFDNSSVSIDHSAFLMMKSGHCLMTEKLSEKNHYKSVLLFFTNDILLKFLRKIELSTTQSVEYHPVYSFSYDEFIRRFVDSLLDITHLSKNTQHQILEVKLEEILLYLAEIYGTDFLYSLTLKHNDSPQKFIRTVERNQLSKLSLSELAFLCNMSISTFKRTFEKHYAESPMKWFQNKRLEHAHYLLNQGQKNSSEIYEEAGYENLSSFIQTYKSKYGMTPKQHHKN
ncbi:AraC family transcriptional regulator [Chryseobacterium elymi]|uniref:AraC family transcriptional regulator n=1 Tax=Chryseobacterium elymi TaxID=395936 RepID=A0A3D9D8L1_9FLAO|nr:AraC family transcriptional regulator [Chryseobacterium elymi]REC74335.1 AraC family transcriptional regulator [Chryseobacterium elymi]